MSKDKDNELMPKDSGVYRWVKASEQMIELYWMVPAKQGNLLGTLSRGHENFVLFKYEGGVNSYTIKSENLGSIEWLEEIPVQADQDATTKLQSQLEEKDKEIERLKGLLKSEFWFARRDFLEQTILHSWQIFIKENNLL